jgi:ferredoxin-NADP reductase
MDEFQAAEARYASFRIHPVFSNIDGRLDVAKIEAASGSVAGKDVYICGPVALTEALTGQLLAKGLRRGQIHFEEFNFR